jgi:hypothetical protein
LRVLVVLTVQVLEVAVIMENIIYIYIYIYIYMLVYPTAKYLTKCAGQLSNRYLSLVSRASAGETTLVSPTVGETNVVSLIIL